MKRETSLFDDVVHYISSMCCAPNVICCPDVRGLGRTAFLVSNLGNLIGYLTENRKMCFRNALLHGRGDVYHLRHIVELLLNSGFEFESEECRKVRVRESGREHVVDLLDVDIKHNTLRAALGTWFCMKGRLIHVNDVISIRKPILLTKMIIDRTADEYPNSVSREYLHNLIESLRVLLDHDVKVSDVHQMSIVLGNTWKRECGE